jgi:2-polyprenyl-3-methyl-5-hydroxy-6-metoxy-1,4-benzoquinol methylase
MSISVEPELTERQRREREFYNEYALRQRDADVDFAPVEGRERRPQNPYWQVFHLAADRFLPGARLLDFGCGWGVNTVRFARLGYQVEGFDISEVNLEVCRHLAERFGVADRVRVSIQPAEALGYPDASFDVIAGVDILHHVDIPAAIRECRRVLKPGGVAIFREPLENALFDRLRNTAMVRRLFPNRVSLDHHITEDERKLTGRDLATIRGIFPDLTIDRFRMLSRFASLWKSGEMRLEKLDRSLSRVPGFRSLAGTIVMTLRK